MTISISGVYDMNHSIEESLLAKSGLTLLDTETIFNGNGTTNTYHVDPETEMYLLCESDFYGASFAYTLYEYDWKTYEWNVVRSGYAESDSQSETQKVHKEMAEALKLLYDNGFELVCD